MVKWNQLHGLPSWAKNTKATFWDVQEDSQEDNPDVIGVKREKALVESNLSRPHLSGFSRAAEQQNESPRVKSQKERQTQVSAINEIKENCRSFELDLVKVERA